MLEFLARDLARHGDVVAYPKPDHTVFLLRHPDHVRRVLESNHTNYRRSSTYELLRLVMGDGLLNSEGAVWRAQRRMMQPFFGKQSLPAFARVVLGQVGAMADRWDRREDPDAELDVAAEFSRTLVDIGCLYSFSCDAGELATTIQWALRDIFVELDRRMGELGRPAPPVSRAREESLERGIRALKDGVDALVARRKAMGPAPDLFETLRNSTDPVTGLPLGDEAIRDQVTTLMIAAHDTTASMLSWSLYLLCRHPAVEARMREELDRVLGGRPPELADVAALPYTMQVIHETLRLYPPAWSIDRVAVAQDRMGDTVIPAGSVVIVSPYFTHRHPGFWPDAERFDPDRFLPELEGTRPKYAYFPFSGGPRICIGKEQALVEGCLALALLLSRFEFRLPAGRTVVMKPAIILKPRGGLPLEVRPRALRAPSGPLPG